MYPDYKSLRTGNVLLCRTKEGIEGKLLRLLLNSYWNHAAIVLIKHNQAYILEAKGGERIKLIPYKEWCDSLDREIKVIDSTCDSKSITRYIGTSYDYQSVIGFLFPSFVRDVFFKNNNKGLYCFEFIGKVFKIESKLYTPQLLENNLCTYY